jgi:hypothetical protein
VVKKEDKEKKDKKDKKNKKKKNRVLDLNRFEKHSIYTNI